MSDTEPLPALEQAILWVAHPAMLFQRVGGINVLERHLFTAARAGIRRIWVGLHPPEADIIAALRIPPGIEVRWAPHGGTAIDECVPPYVGLSADHFIRIQTLRYVLDQPHPQSLSYSDDAGLGVVQVVLSRNETVARRTLALPEDSYRRLEAPLRAERTIAWLMAAGPKSQDGFMARNFDRHISMSVSTALLESAVTPNMMTLASTAIGLLGASFFLGSSRAWYVPGALLVWLHSVLDGCDGELARVRFQESALGSDLDFWGDNLVHLALFTCLGLGFWRDGHGPIVLLLSTVADLNVVAAAWTAWGHRRSKRAADAVAPEAGVGDAVEGTDIRARLSRLQNALAQRDFIYLLVVLAFVDCVYEFLWAAAIGGLLYFAIMLHLRRYPNHDYAQNPHPAR